MKTSVYFEAAQLLPAADGKRHPIYENSALYYTYGCCDAIESACNHGHKWPESYVHEFTCVFKPPRACSAYWFDYNEQDQEIEDEENCANARVLALLFMHWMTVNP